MIDMPIEPWDFLTCDPDKIRLGFLTGQLKNVSKEEVEEIERQRIDQSKQELGKCYEDIINFLKKWVDIPEDTMKLLAIWIIGTYFHKQFDTYPYIFLNAMRGSGKTRLLKILSWLQKNGNGEVLNNPSESVMFRTAQERGLIFDEFESEKSKEKQTMREYLNACYKKGGVVYRMEKQKVDNKEKQVAVGYPLYTPVALANINGIEDVLADRSITIILEKSMNPYLVKKIEDFFSNPLLADLKVRLNRFSVELCSVYLPQKHTKAWNEYIECRYNTSIHILHTLHYSTPLYTDTTFDEVCKKIDATGIFGRNFELFFPLMITGKIICNDIFEDIIRIALEFNKTKKNDEFNESKDVSLFEFVAKADRHRFNYILVSDLLKEFKEFIGSHGEEDERWITSNWLGMALRRLNLLSDKKRMAKGQMVLLAVDKAKEKVKMFQNEDESFHKEAV